MSLKEFINIAINMSLQDFINIVSQKQNYVLIIAIIFAIILIFKSDFGPFGATISVFIMFTLSKLYSDVAFWIVTLTFFSIAIPACIYFKISDFIADKEYQTKIKGEELNE